jgi:hypothetical protein
LIFLVHPTASSPTVSRKIYFIGPPVGGGIDGGRFLRKIMRGEERGVNHLAFRLAREIAKSQATPRRHRRNINSPPAPRSRLRFRDCSREPEWSATNR